MNITKRNILDQLPVARQDLLDQAPTAHHVKRLDQLIQGLLDKGRIRRLVEERDGQIVISYA